VLQEPPAPEGLQDLKVPVVKEVVQVQQAHQAAQATTEAQDQQAQQDQPVDQVQQALQVVTATLERADHPEATLSIALAPEELVVSSKFDQTQIWTTISRPLLLLTLLIFTEVSVDNNL